ncbi:endolytic transglycosylase MltG [Prosthecochloris sp. N3]|uniref:Endolytic murein transglycosylase n=1 Tax=Prosthecochloris ethylica TaxID=2743976 RepID=A0ABR9XR59_9CHLB|nr:MULTISPECIES: endolytic transglycosylase MltG [Prosthecochloris]MBF0586089.1 endolytic transglycosylase MltG [Prosthecochloris ethylica]MBF0636511.1 endolytic transglycosylase MltG [Prosthecochloris ethylica]NUK47143.1 endolytic transglycosylase MltG [Prosthecochloris ethylica]RNA65687.1 endolytic transglycosylase MltG [Prosthecochloris sp. ZM_2]
MRETVTTRLLVFTASLLIPSLSFLAVFFLAPGWNISTDGLQDTRIAVHRGASFRTIVSTLQQQGIVRHERPLLITAALFPELRNIKPGRYTVPPGMANYTLLEYLRSRPQDEEQVMIPVGVRQERIASIIGRQLDTDSLSVMTRSQDRAFLDTLGITAESFEGYSFPGTYNFPWASTSGEVLQFLAGRFRSFFNDSLQARARELGMSELEILTLASIVEAETPLDREKPLIAGVYHNRLKRNMKLQADPTVQYALGDRRERLLYKDLETDSPYNTYRYRGLPPGPICNPGEASIRAALFPAETRHLYFVATGDGGHYFAETHSEHLRNVRKYRRSRY